MRRFRQRSHQCWVSAIFWGFMHALFAAGWFLSATWLFLVFSAKYLEVRASLGVRRAIISVSLFHAAVNGCVVIQNVLYFQFFGAKGW